MPTHTIVRTSPEGRTKTFQVFNEEQLKYFKDLENHGFKLQIQRFMPVCEACEGWYNISNV